MRGELGEASERVPEGMHRLISLKPKHVGVRVPREREEELGAVVPLLNWEGELLVTSDVGPCREDLHCDCHAWLHSQLFSLRIASVGVI